MIVDGSKTCRANVGSRPPAVSVGVAFASAILLEAIVSLAILPSSASAQAQHPPGIARERERSSSPSRPIDYVKTKRFTISFNVESPENYKELQLWYSEDRGGSWTYWGTTPLTNPSFQFQADHDAEYWFAARTMDLKGRLSPADDRDVEPIMKVVVDTKKPTLNLEPRDRRGGRVSLRYEVSDAHLDLTSLTLEYQAEGARSWRQVRIRRPARIGVENWDAGTADVLHVRAAAADRAGNRTQVELTLPEESGLANVEDDPRPKAPAPIAMASDRSKADSAFSNPDDSEPQPIPLPGASSAAESRPISTTNPSQPAARDDREPSANAVGESNPAVDGSRTITVGNPRFALQYAVEDAGPEGPAEVELYVTRDAGRHWAKLGEDPDRRSPFWVDLEGEGTYGLILVARSAGGFGDPPPQPGDPPQTWVVVDQTPPLVRLEPPKMGDAGKLIIAWKADDPHLGPRPVVISYRPDRPDAIWQQITERIPNTGRYEWALPANVAPKFHIRVDVIDTLGNQGTADTAEIGPVTVDRTRPKGRILGIDPSASRINRNPRR